MQAIPVTILAGSDLDARPAEGPTSGLHPLCAYKGAELRFQGRPLVVHLAERLAQTEGFGPVRVAGPAKLYRECCPGFEVVDTDGSVGTNIGAAIEHHDRTTPGPLGLMASDILLTTAELGELRREYERARPAALWFPLVAKPADPDRLGAFAWKPSYKIRRTPDAAPIDVLPGHFGIFEPAALRLGLLHRLLDAAYRARNHSLHRKRATMLSAVIGGLLSTDVKLLLSLRAPTRTIEVLTNGLRVARDLRADRLTLPTLESALTHLILRRSHRRAQPDSTVTLPVLDVVSLAKDVDTAEELEALMGPE